MGMLITVLSVIYWTNSVFILTETAHGYLTWSLRHFHISNKIQQT